MTCCRTCCQCFMPGETGGLSSFFSEAGNSCVDRRSWGLGRELDDAWTGAVEGPGTKGVVVRMGRRTGVVPSPLIGVGSEHASPGSGGGVSGLKETLGAVMTRDGVAAMGRAVRFCSTALLIAVPVVAREYSEGVSITFPAGITGRRRKARDDGWLFAAASSRRSGDDVRGISTVLVVLGRGRPLDVG